MAKFLQQRCREDEWMDAPDVDPALLAISLRFIRRINSLLRYTQATLHHLKRFRRDWKPGERIRILDVATGSGDVPLAIKKWAIASGLNITIMAVDLHHETLRAAQNLVASHPINGSGPAPTLGTLGKDIQFARASATRLPFADAQFDYVFTSMFLHHLDELVVVDVLKELDRVASRGLIVADLLRSRRAYAWISLFTFFANPMVRHDARVSITGAMNREELLRCRDKAGLTYLKPTKHFGHRLVLAGAKQDR